MELKTRPLDPDARIVQLQQEVTGLQMIAGERCLIRLNLSSADSTEDYERHLREPSRKVREDVEKEWSGKVSTLKSQLESKTIWANRLDENVRMVTAENKALHMVSSLVHMEC